MRIPRIYQDGHFKVGESIELSAEAFQHVVKVLRLKQNSMLAIFDGLGASFKSEITIIDKRTCHVNLLEVTHSEPPKLQITLVQSIIKPDKMDLVMQKAVELGVTRIIPVLSENTQMKHSAKAFEKKHQHWQKIIIGACEQCGSDFLPELFEIQSLQASIKLPHSDLNIVLDPYANKNFTDLPTECKNVSIVVGPEGGLTATEVKLLNTNQFISVKFGTKILRAETAAIAAVTISQYRWN